MASLKDDRSNNSIKYSDIDKVRFYGIGTAMYTAITIALHPINVIKTRHQVLSNYNNNGGENLTRIGSSSQRAGTTHASSRFLSSSSSSSLSTTIYSNFGKIPTFYRGLGIVLVLAIPARGVYLGVLESSKEEISSFLTSRAVTNGQTYSPLIASLSGGLSGGLAAMSSQAVIVPMDVISQRQMVMESSLYNVEGSAMHIMKNIIQTSGVIGFYRGFGMSLFTSLPVGTLWWATYSGSQQFLQGLDVFNPKHNQSYRDDNEYYSNRIKQLMSSGMVQCISGLNAAIIAATLTQPLDVVKTRLQVGKTAKSLTYTQVAKELYITSGFRGFFRGTVPRITTITLWGTVLSSAYEYLRHISRKDY